MIFCCLNHGKRYGIRIYLAVVFLIPIGCNVYVLYLLLGYWLRLQTFQLSVCNYLILTEGIRRIIYILLSQWINIEKSANIRLMISPFELIPT